MCDEENRLVPKSLNDQLLKYIWTNVRVDCAQRIIEKVNIPETKKLLQNIYHVLTIVTYLSHITIARLYNVNTEQW